MSTAVAEMVGLWEEVDVNEDSVSPSSCVQGVFPVVGKGEASAAGKESLCCGQAHARGRASNGHDLSGERNHCAAKNVEK